MRRETVHIALRRFSLFLLAAITMNAVFASSHREAPLISNDPLADNTDLYAFVSPDDPSSVTIIANYIPFELPEGGPNYYTFGENIRYEIHIKNRAENPGEDDITYRFTFHHENQDPTTFFNIRLGAQNIRTTYTLEKIIRGGAPVVIIQNGIVPANNIGPRSIDSAGIGLGTSYEQQIQNSITYTEAGEQVFCGPADDPFFVDLAGAFDVGNFRPEGNTTNPTKDGLARYNVHSIAIRAPMQLFQKDGKGLGDAKNMLDPDYVIGVWASASRQQIKTINDDGTKSYSGDWVQVSRLGMPLTNEAIIPVGMKDKWNATTPAGDADYISYFSNPELALYMDDRQFGTAVPSLNQLRIQTNAQTVLGNVDFGNTHPGLYVLKGNPALNGTALDPAAFGDILLPDDHSPRAVDLLPIFYTGVPNLAPYQLATGKPDGNPLAPGKPFINNFLPTLGDYLRLNMAVPVTDRKSADFNSLGIVSAAVLGLTDARFNTTPDLQFIPNMDGFPNGRRLEDDVTTIELQAVSGVALAAIGLFYDDHTIGIGQSPVTQQLANVLGFNAGVTKNDTALKPCFPYVQGPWRGFTGEGYVGPHSTVLPVHFLSFTAAKANQTVALRWQVENQANAAYYNVEYSTDGNHYSTLTKVMAHSSDVYQYSHLAPSMIDINYYRITEVDKDGRTIISPVQPIKFMLSNILTVSPNPATTVVRVNATQSNLTLTMYDNGGRRVATQVMNSNTATFNVSSLAKGTYTIVATDRNGKRVEVKKVLKQ